MRKTQERKKLHKQLEKISHDYIRRRDSFNENETGGKCFDCETISYGQQFQAGHFIPDAVGGALLRYHPHNMHGQSGGCNMKHRQEWVKIGYTKAIIKKYGQSGLKRLLGLKNRSIKADSLWYLKMIELYTEGNEKKIVDFLERCATL